ncbi:hypothetical protein [Cohaesibacter celericrescens]|uniref:Uncharacterized protein n=1 Tax=Cohaesibacter celericrescens TaxID=2067669 RepID=A0A2N5XR71_9HYPH|nr:hypothetical protein [Cohaesibacter celericrescens]PLW76950.1 hypothetical protein C0081_12960 [Cohaesibacter celericrescens]
MTILLQILKLVVKLAPLLASLSGVLARSNQDRDASLNNHRDGRSDQMTEQENSITLATKAKWATKEKQNEPETQKSRSDDLFSTNVVDSLRESDGFRRD